MNSFEINKIFAAILVTVLIVLGIGKISNMIFDKEQTDVVAYKVEAPEGSAVQTKSEATLDLSSFFAAGDIAHGEKVFKKCAACHSVNKEGKNKIGPKLWNVMFRPVGLLTDYKYSKALSAYKKEWTWEEMNGFLIKPAKWIKGNKMGFAGLKSDKDRASVILYLNQNSDNPRPLP
tara:strand:+ start:780 stop:1307 length:528 start_codon:yes stop_codon:yes gene_type:complete